MLGLLSQTVPENNCKIFYHIHTLVPFSLQPRDEGYLSASSYSDLLRRTSDDTSLYYRRIIAILDSVLDF